MKPRNIILLFGVSLTVFTACPKEDSLQVDELQQVGILGEWKLQIRFIDNVTDLTAPCCDYMEFKEDGQTDDLQGAFSAYGVGYETDGVFELNENKDTILFEYDDEQRVYDFHLSDDVITFRYAEDDREIVEDWKREN